jgi:hypothetical protein
MPTSEEIKAAKEYAKKHGMTKRLYKYIDHLERFQARVWQTDPENPNRPLEEHEFNGWNESPGWY